MKSSKLENVPIKDNKDTLVYRLLTNGEMDDNKCVVILPNSLQCPKKPVAFILECPQDIFDEVKSQTVCGRHLGLIKNAAVQYKFKIKEFEPDGYNTEYPADKSPTE